MFKMSQTNIIFIGNVASLVVLKIAAPELYIAMNGMDNATIYKYNSAFDQTSASI